MNRTQSIAPVALCLAFLLAAGPLAAQIATGAVSGAVVDQTRSAIPGVTVRLVAATTSAARETTTDPDGNFQFNAIAAGEYTLTIERAGFKRYVKQNIQLTPNEQLAVGAIQLSVGEVTESITVQAQGAAVQTSTGERSGVITAEEVQNLTVMNRDFATLVALMPGVVDTPSAAEVMTQGQNSNFNVQGSRTTSNNVTIDGMSMGNSNQIAHSNFVSMDSVQTVRILVSNYQAEFGRKPGASIMAVTKSGSKQYHGVGYFYYRHEWMGSNDFFNNRSGLPKSPRRIQTPGFNFGGPVYIPRLLDHRNSKLFFFTSLELIRERRPGAIQNLTVPTALERQGDFSRSVGANGRAITINDPADNKRPFPGNVVPKSRVNPRTQAFLNLLPVANVTDVATTAYAYNYQAQDSLRAPKMLETTRVDYIVNAATTLWFRYNHWREDQQGWAVSAANTAWGWLPNHYRPNADVPMLSATHILNPTTVLEAQVGISRWTEFGGPLSQTDMERLNRTKSGATIAQLWPGNNPDNLVPNATFAGITNPPNASLNVRFPLRGAETTYTASATLTNTRGRHTFKYGLYAEQWRAIKGESGNWNGTLAFGTDTNNPGDANNAFANAILGNFQSYTESNTRPPLYENTSGIEWFAQDNWKVSRKLTLDVGLRFGWSQPWYSPRRQEAGFVPSLFDPKNNVVLMQPVRINNARQAQDPFTGKLYNANLIGAIVPDHGKLFNGTVNLADDRNYPQGLRHSTGVKVMPRIGFSYDPFGNGKTAIRGGFGIFYEIHEKDNWGYSLHLNPPSQLTPQIWYGNVDTISQAQGFIFPVATSGFDPNRPLGRVMNYSFGVQRDVGHGVLVDVAYVGALSRHLLERKNLNSIALGTTYLASAQDPSNPGSVLASQYLRPYIGYGDILYYRYDANSSYHSMQVQVNRRFARGLSGAVVWTWSKAMDYDDLDTQTISYLADPKVRDYGLAGFDRTHIVKMSWIYELPRGSSLLRSVGGRSGFGRAVLDGWQLSGITTFMSGAPQGVSLSLTSGNANNWSGSPTDAARTDLIANPILPKDQRTFSRFFNTAAFAMPARSTWGNAAPKVVRGPGINNFDISMFKNFRLTERLRGQFRCEAYNAFNHTQFSAVNTTSQFNVNTGALTSLSFGQLTASRLPRRMQLALRINF
jgi:hypothetical protein